MKTTLSAIALAASVTLAFALPARAEDRSVDLIGSVNWVSTQTSGHGVNGDVTTGDLDLDLNDKVGYGGAVNVWWSPSISTEFGVSTVEPDVTFKPANFGGTTITGGKLRMTPITAALQWHFLQGGRFDPYIGAGGAYAMFDQVDTLGAGGVSNVTFDDAAGFLVNAGLSIGLTKAIGINADAKYMMFSPKAQTTFVGGAVSASDNVDFNPLIVSAGLRFSF